MIKYKTICILFLLIYFISISYIWIVKTSVFSVIINVIHQIMQHWAVWGCWYCQLVPRVAHVALWWFPVFKGQTVNKSALLKQKGNLASTVVHIKFLVMFALVVSQGFPKTTSNNQILSPVVCFGSKWWFLSGIWTRTGACCEACRGIGQWKGLAYWIPESAWNMPGLTLAVERKRAGRKLWRSEGYFWLSLSSFLLHDLGRGLLAAYTVCTEVVVEEMQQRMGPHETHCRWVAWATSGHKLSLYCCVAYIRDEQQAFFPSAWYVELLSWIHEKLFQTAHSCKVSSSLIVSMQGKMSWINRLVFYLFSLLL